MRVMCAAEVLDVQKQSQKAACGRKGERVCVAMWEAQVSSISWRPSRVNQLAADSAQDNLRDNDGRVVTPGHSFKMTGLDLTW